MTKRLQFKSDESEIEFSGLVNEFERCKYRIEKTRESFLQKDRDKDQVKISLDYYKDQRSIILGKMKDLLVDHAEGVE